MEAFPNGKNVDGPDALEDAWWASVADSAEKWRESLRTSGT